MVFSGRIRNMRIRKGCQFQTIKSDCWANEFWVIRSLQCTFNTDRRIPVDPLADRLFLLNNKGSKSNPESKNAPKKVNVLFTLPWAWAALWAASGSWWRLAEERREVYWCNENLPGSWDSQCILAECLPCFFGMIRILDQEVIKSRVENSELVN